MSVCVSVWLFVCLSVCVSVSVRTFCPIPDSIVKSPSIASDRFPGAMYFTLLHVYDVPSLLFSKILIFKFHQTHDVFTPRPDMAQRGEG